MEKQRNSLQRVVLTGFMGCGKTTVGGLLAARLRWSFVDLDDVISSHCGLSIPEIFSQMGEAHFRREESLALASCFARVDLVMAMGGGAPETAENRALLRRAPETAVVYLQGSFDALRARCLAQSAKKNAVGRPILSDPEEARQRFARRLPLYAEIATLTLQAEDAPEDIAEQIAALLGF